MSYTFRGIELPENLKESLDAYVQTGRPLGDFLRSCVSNDLRYAIGYADETNVPAIPAIVGYLYNQCPQGCWGSPALYEAWLRTKRLERQQASRNPLYSDEEIPF